MRITLLFGFWGAILSSFFHPNENKALAAPTQALKPYIVVIDPGHGGGDLGASVKAGKKRVTEKEITLSIAVHTSRILEDPEYWKPLGRPVKTILTRKRDKDVSLQQRSKIAKSSGADLFLSIHANSDPSRRAQGLETYFLNNTDDSSTAKLEQIEKKSAAKTPQGKLDDAALLLRSVSADAVVGVSREAAATIHNSLVSHLRSGELKINDRGVRQGMFYVLLDSQVPAVLLEAFFLSHPSDREFVEQPENRQKIAEGIARGVLRFLAVR